MWFWHHVTSASCVRKEKEMLALLLWLPVVSSGVHQCREAVTSLHYAVLITDVIQSHIWWLLLIGMPPINCSWGQEPENLCKEAATTALHFTARFCSSQLYRKMLMGQQDCIMVFYNHHCVAGCLTLILLSPGVLLHSPHCLSKPSSNSDSTSG